MRNLIILALSAPGLVACGGQSKEDKAFAEGCAALMVTVAEEAGLDKEEQGVVL